MENQRKIYRITGVLIFIIGLVLGLLFNVVSVLGDLEGMSFWGMQEVAMYDPQLPLDAKLNSLNCPLLITSRETGSVTARISNPLKKPIQSVIQADISNTSEDNDIRQDRQEINLGSGETRDFSWEVTPGDKIYGRLILVRVYLYQNLSDGPARTAHCGILVVDLAGWASRQIIILTVLASLVGMVAGVSLWVSQSQPLFGRTGHLAFGLVWLLVVTLVGMITNLIGAFLLSAGLLVLAVISLVSLVEYMFLPRLS